MKPSLRGYTRPVRISRAFVPASMISSFVRTPMVRLPCGSTDRASLRESEFARSALAGETARITLVEDGRFISVLLGQRGGRDEPVGL